MSTNIIVIGAGGLAREVLLNIKAHNKMNSIFDYNIICFMVESKYFQRNKFIENYKIKELIIKESLKPVKGISYLCAIGDIQTRYRIINSLENKGFNSTILIHPSCLEFGNYGINVGSIIAPGCIISDNVTIGKYVYINLACTIGHDVKIGDYSVISPGVHLSGNVEIGQGCLIGTGANIIEKIKIGNWASIAAGAAIFEDVPDNATVVGNPGRIMQIKKEGWHLNNE